VTLPTDATIPSDGPVQVVVQPTVNNLAPETYRGKLTLQFSHGRVSTVGGGAKCGLGRVAELETLCIL